VCAMWVQAVHCPSDAAARVRADVPLCVHCCLPAHTGDVMPSGHEGEMYAGGVKIIVHPMIEAAGKDADKVGGVCCCCCCCCC
jgi:hypothetical protein